MTALLPLKQAQRESLKKLLRLEGSEDNLNSSNQWKVLIYDEACQKIISPQLTVQDLRREGVTLHLLLSSKREQINHIPAIYFIHPSSLPLVAADCASNKYGHVHIHCSPRIPRVDLEKLAQNVVSTQSLHKIASITDQFLNFVCPEDYLFSLNMHKTYLALNRPDVSEAEVKTKIESIAYGLLSVVVTSGALPIIRCDAKGGAAEMVARQLLKYLKEHSYLFPSNHSRPLLVISDRNEDLITPLQHTSTYQALVDDLLEHNKANRVRFRDQNSKKTLDVDPDTDTFYSNYKFAAFPEAIESNGTALAEVTQKEQEIRAKAGGGGGAASTSNAGNNNTHDLAAAVESLPKLLERKKQLEMHTTILQAVMNEVAARDVPVFYELESAIASGHYKNDKNGCKTAVLNLVTNNKGNLEDKIRLICVYALSDNAPSSGSIDEVLGALRSSFSKSNSNDGDDTDNNTFNPMEEQYIKSIEYIKKLRAMHMISAVDFTEESSISNRDNSKSSAAGIASFMANQATGLLAKAADKVSSVMGKVHKHHLTQVVENLCNQRPNTEDESYLYLDPKVGLASGEVDVMALKTSGVGRVPIREVIAFVIGGGCYSEYQNLQLVANSHNNSEGGGSSRTTVKITYGSTELTDPTDFLLQMGELSKLS